MTENEYLTTQEVADLLRTSAETVRYWRHIGRGPKSFKVGRRVLYAREDLNAFIAEARGATSDPSRSTPDSNTRHGV
jgi:excisionase family DNA binding protein